MTKYIPTSAYEPAFPLDWEGLDYASANDATPKLYGVSFGNGNDGVSHMFPAYYVRTADPYTLARAALLGQFKPEWMAQAGDEMEIDGESEYTIYATISDPLERETDSDEDSEESDEDSGSYSDANGSWFICEVFPESDPRDGTPIYDSLDDCYGNGPELTLARASEG